MKISLVKISTILLLGTGVILGGCGATSTIDAVQQNRQAQIYFKYGKYEDAVRLLKSSLDADYENPASHYWLGRCYEIKGNMTKAILEYELAVRFAPALDLAQVALIDALHRTGQEEKSVQATRSYLRYKRAPAFNVSQLAEGFAQQGMDTQALLAYQRAHEVEPANPVPILKLADFYFEKGQEEEGIESLIEALKIDPLYPGLARRLGEYGRRVEIPEPPMFHVPSDMERELHDLED